MALAPTEAPARAGLQTSPPIVADTRFDARIGKAEWRWLGGAIVVILALTFVPALVERFFGPASRVHLGTYWYAQDFSQYLAAMNEGARTGSWLIHDHFTSEPHNPALMYPLYVAIGKLAGATGIPVLAIYSVVELATRVILPVSVYVFIAACLDRVSQRRLAFVLAIFTGGLGVEAWMVKSALGVGLTSVGEPPGVNTYLEVVTFGILFAAPHIGLGLAATLFAPVAYHRASQGSNRAFGCLALDVVFLALVHPFNLPVVLSALSVDALIQCWRARRLVWRALGAAMLACLAGAPLVLVNFLTFNFDPFWSLTYGAQNVMPSPRPWDLPTDYGVVLLLGIPGAIFAARAPRGMQRLALVWLALGALWIYVPVPYQRRFAFGLQPVLATFSALGWPLALGGAQALMQKLPLRPSLQRGLALRSVQYPLAILGFAGTLTTYLVVTASAATNQPFPIYIVDRDTFALGEALAQRSSVDDVVVSSFNTGNVLAGLVPGRAVLGYDVATLHSKKKRATIDAAYAGQLSDAELRTFLQENRATYLITGAEERKLGPVDPGQRLGFPVEAREGETILYRVSS